MGCLLNMLWSHVTTTFRRIDRLGIMTEGSANLYNAYSQWDPFWGKQPGMKLYPASSGQDVVTHTCLHSLFSFIIIIIIEIFTLHIHTSHARAWIFPVSAFFARHHSFSSKSKNLAHVKEYLQNCGGQQSQHWSMHVEHVGHSLSKEQQTETDVSTHKHCTRVLSTSLAD